MAGGGASTSTVEPRPGGARLTSRGTLGNLFDMSDVERRSSLKRSIGRLESSIGRRYEGAETHYDRVAVDLIALYEDPLLAEAGFLHGIPSRVLPQIAPDPLPGVAEVLASWSVLRGSLQGGVKSPSPSAPPPMAMLDGLREPRAAPLLAIDCLDRWDPRGAMREWTRQFCRRAAPPPAREPFDPLDGPASAMGATDAHERWREDQALGYLRTVAAPVAEFCGLWLERSASLNLAFRGERPEVFDQIVRWCIARQVSSASTRSTRSTRSCRSTA